MIEQKLLEAIIRFFFAHCNYQWDLEPISFSTLFCRNKFNFPCSLHQTKKNDINQETLNVYETAPAVLRLCMTIRDFQIYLYDRIESELSCAFNEPYLFPCHLQHFPAIPAIGGAAVQRASEVEAFRWRRNMCFPQRWGRGSKHVHQVKWWVCWAELMRAATKLRGNIEKKNLFSCL